MDNDRSAIKFIIIDDHILFSEGLSDILNLEYPNAFITVQKSPDYVIDMIIEDKFDIALIDINMPDICGLTLLENIRKENLNIKIIIISVRFDIYTISRAKELGANGYIVKNESKSNFISVINHVLTNKDFLCNQELNAKRSDKYLFSNGKKIHLTLKEIEILSHLCGELCSKEIAVKMNISEHTVIGYRKSLFQKFEVKNMVGLVRYSIDLGLI